MAPEAFVRTRHSGTRAAVSRALTGGLAAIFSACLATFGRAEEVERKQALGRKAALRIHNMVGSVIVHGWNKDTVLVRGTLGAGDKLPHGRRLYRSRSMFVELLYERDPKPTRSRGFGCRRGSLPCGRRRLRRISKLVGSPEVSICTW